MAHVSHPTSTSTSRPPFYRDSRNIGIFIQIIFLLVVAATGGWLVNNMLTNSSGGAAAVLGFDFLGQTAGFEISEGPAFTREESFGRAFMVGVANTARVGITGIVLATLLGLLAGIARLSNNWLLNKIATVYVEVIRSTPLLVQLFFWYFAVILQLPEQENALTIAQVGMISNRGVFLTWPFITEAGQAYIWWLLAAALAALGSGWWRRRQLAAQGKIGSGIVSALAAFALIAMTGYFVTAVTGSLPDQLSYELRRGDRGILFADIDGDGAFTQDVDRPMRFVPVDLLDGDGKVLASTVTTEEGEFRFFEPPEGGTTIQWQTPGVLFLSTPEIQGPAVRGGLTMSAEFVGLLLGLVIYTGAFIAEIVRAGINAVSKGQWEASRALGLSTRHILIMIILPQALRIIIPPLTSQYLNLVKNSSLAIAVGYPDLFNVSLTILNQSGAEVQMFLIIMGTYLTFSLITSSFMNWYNRRVALVER